jgi:putative hemolysin
MKPQGNPMHEATARIQQQTRSRFWVGLALDDVEVAEAQQLRYHVFADEMGARLPSAHLGLDIDAFDAFCDHLIVRDRESRDVVGTYRILSPSQAKKAGGYYSEQEFDLVRFHQLRPRMAELGRSCVHPDYRSGAVIALLWNGLADYMIRHGYHHIIGCASVTMADGGYVAAKVYEKLIEKFLSPIDWRARPRNRLPLESLTTSVDALPPPLIKAYVRLGARVCGEPSWDPDFNTADLLMMLPMERLNTAYARRLLPV